MSASGACSLEVNQDTLELDTGNVCDRGFVRVWLVFRSLRAGAAVVELPVVVVNAVVEVVAGMRVGFLTVGVAPSARLQWVVVVVFVFVWFGSERGNVVGIASGARSR